MAACLAALSSARFLSSASLSSANFLASSAAISASLFSSASLANLSSFLIKYKIYLNKINNHFFK
jgi:hypothetical protein